MEKLMDHILQRQNNQELKEEMAEVKAEVSRLSSLIKEQMASSPRPVEIDVRGALQVNTGSVSMIHQSAQQMMNVTNVTNIKIRPWGGEDRVLMTATMVKEAFTENPRLIEYCRMTDNEKTNAELAAPYVLEALMDLLKRAHADPAARNMYLSPRRADQVMIFDEEKWQVITLVESIRGVFDSIARGVHRLMVTNSERVQVPIEVQASASWVPRMYEDASDTYVAMAKGPMAAHLTNMALASQPQITI